jgi:hypothetical protein
MTPLIKIHSRLSPRIFKEIRNDPNELLRGSVGTEKKPEAENLVSDLGRNTEFFEKHTEFRGISRNSAVFL